MSAEITRAFEAIARRLDIVLRAAGRNEEAARYVQRMARVEQLLTASFDMCGLPVERLTCFRRLAARVGNDEALGSMLAVIVDDVHLVFGGFVPELADQRWFETGGQGRRFVVGAPESIAVPGTGPVPGWVVFLTEAAKSYSVGLARSDPVAFRRYAHNVHLPAQLLRSPEDFLPAQLVAYMDGLPQRELRLQLEHNPEAVTSITDLTVHARVAVTADLGGRRVMLGDRPIDLQVTFDSKVSYAPETLQKYRSVDQQFNLFSGDRWHLPHGLLHELGLHGASETDKAAFLREFVPAGFGHYLFVPSDFDDPGNSVGRFYRTAFRRYIPGFAEVQRKSGMVRMSRRDYDLCIAALEDYVDDHFGGQKFLNRNSRMRLY